MFPNVWQRRVSGDDKQANCGAAGGGISYRVRRIARGRQQHQWRQQCMALSIMTPVAKTSM